MIGFDLSTCKLSRVGSLLFGAAVALVGCHQATLGPNLPFIETNACPFECCQLGKWIARSPLVVYEEERDRSSVAFRIQPGEAFVAERANLHVDRPGIVRVTIAGEQYRVDDTLYIVGYRGEGVFSVWYDGKLQDVADFWSGPPRSDGPGPAGVQTQKTHMVWWVLISDDRERTGWLRMVNRAQVGFFTKERIDGRDGCA